jgi:hypothetical protein
MTPRCQSHIGCLMMMMIVMMVVMMMKDKISDVIAVLD